MSGSDIPALGVATSVRQMGEEGGEWQQLQLPDFPLLLHVCQSPEVTDYPSLKCPSWTESCCSLFSVSLRFTGSKVLALPDIWPRAIFAYCKSKLFLSDEPEPCNAFSSPQHVEREGCSLKLLSFLLLQFF